MQHFIECTFTRPTGGSFPINNIQNIWWGVDRSTAANGHVGMKGHNIYNIQIQRLKSLQIDNVAQQEDDTIQLAAATEKKAYFDGEITIARADDADDIVQTLRWSQGHICKLNNQIDGDEIVETFEISVTDLQVNDAEFRRNVTA